MDLDGGTIGTIAVFVITVVASLFDKKRKKAAARDKRPPIEFNFPEEDDAEPSPQELSRPESARQDSVWPDPFPANPAEAPDCRDPLEAPVPVREPIDITVAGAESVSKPVAAARSSAAAARPMAAASRPPEPDPHAAPEPKPRLHIDKRNLVLYSEILKPKFDGR